mmetsp:Transcript_3882/g.10117  ORF Transcript_3882/g.10117 Transcript_3882/m.10117 type:complete len:234 (+) Transcript_3882:203-904(+)
MTPLPLPLPLPGWPPKSARCCHSAPACCIMFAILAASSSSAIAKPLAGAAAWPAPSWPLTPIPIANSPIPPAPHELLSPPPVPPAPRSRGSLSSRGSLCMGAIAVGRFALERLAAPRPITGATPMPPMPPMPLTSAPTLDCCVGFVLASIDGVADNIDAAVDGMAPERLDGADAAAAALQPPISLLSGTRFTRMAAPAGTAASSSRYSSPVCVLVSIRPIAPALPLSFWSTTS